MISTKEINDLIRNVVHKINYESCDYEVSIKLLQSTGNKGSFENILTSLFEKEVTVTNLKKVSKSQILDSMEFALTHVDYSPAPYFGTEDHKQDVHLIQQLFSSLLYRYEEVYTFDIPYETYLVPPIFWGFSYYIRYEDCIVVFVASASD
ncbi:hypothetical protein [Leucothrix arctica]|uniref:Uncharacterized protein n=1 Tax=Leucothrix arctica TaxID=1481894 RepID=A0A317CBP2_9GAMM|nr:hypothetical protein [Leucothrix arctica]PWQ93502.1 hypothetical protein DKT75_17940 [Leucothrix arctica]